MPKVISKGGHAAMLLETRGLTKSLRNDCHPKRNCRVHDTTSRRLFARDGSAGLPTELSSLSVCICFFLFPRPPRPVLTLSASTSVLCCLHQPTPTSTSVGLCVVLSQRHYLSGVSCAAIERKARHTARKWLSSSGSEERIRKV
jgi:hypothetical protein